MELSWLYRLEPLFIFGAGAFVGAYLKKKAENLATHEDIDKLVDQMKAVTSATKEIEAKISGDLWDRQKLWELKRDALFELAKQALSTEELLSTMYSIWHTNRVNNVTGGERLKKASAAYADLNEASSRYSAALTLARLACGIDLAKAALEHGMLCRTIAADIANGNDESFKRELKNLLIKQNSVFVLIRKELETNQ